MHEAQTPKLGHDQHKLEAEINLAMRHFTGTDHWYRTTIPSILFTDGVKYVGDRCDAHWLINDIAIYQSFPEVKKEEFQVWVLRTDVAQGKAVLTCEDGNNNTVFTYKYAHTDFPLAEMKLWFTNNVIMLPSEY